MDLEVSDWGSSKMFVGTYRWFGSSFSFFMSKKTSLDPTMAVEYSLELEHSLDSEHQKPSMD